ncbi:pyroglutamyl-peptidase 1 [Trichogramma pretiosum]|uniref:pyroglutamyl-peptidase 1 n=1 Tax=Trichogramma pretiosum TaxID=7493 RepID=UPI0006C940AD|nr:pyroglutamyl-peptidase 1 [Trichogramma pretiosum]
METKPKETVLVTGFGLFRDYDVNASWEAVKLLPELFSKSEISSEINLVIEEIPVAYQTVDKKVEELYKKHKPSVILHVGVSNMATCLTVECQANSKGYNHPDIYNEYPNECADHKILKTKCDPHKICEIVNKNSTETNCTACTSTRAGRYLCEYIYYKSLELEEPLVLFVHVPELSIYSSEKTAQGLLDVLIHLIECARSQKKE